MMVSRDDIYTIHRWGIECMNCHEQIEFDEAYPSKLICPYCGEELEFEE